MAMGKLPPHICIFIHIIVSLWVGNYRIIIDIAQSQAHVEPAEQVGVNLVAVGQNDALILFEIVHRETLLNQDTCRHLCFVEIVEIINQRLIYGLLCEHKRRKQQKTDDEKCFFHFLDVLKKLKN